MISAFQILRKFQFLLKQNKTLHCFLGSFYQGGRLDEATDITDILNAPLLL